MAISKLLRSEPAPRAPGSSADPANRRLRMSVRQTCSSHCWLFFRMHRAVRDRYADVNIETSVGQGRKY
ncbi:hypothetical protein JI735_33670 (plasmid) [Paenibacillus sonchi]|uniref:Uncharacterized protein n=1 Tax=Paenibacillus sonchi TaxID=373687 RepID=A0A974SGP4_9BACL|nr:hypothetical protein JI735_33670 [Paenibacillus sonchi]